jgi:hypothetical protein
MTLAQVVYNMSTDMDFAARMRTDPESALAERGLKLSKEEQAFLSKGLTRESEKRVSLSDLTSLYMGWT